MATSSDTAGHLLMFCRKDPVLISVLDHLIRGVFTGSASAICVIFLLLDKVASVPEQNTGKIPLSKGHLDKQNL